jgi:carotenoid cleavage dioxygenase
MEVHCPDADVEGEIPSAVEGTFFAASFNHLYPPQMPYHWFEGDGMMNAFSFRDGRVEWTNKFVRTERYKDMLKAGKSVYRGVTSATVEEMSSVEGYLGWRHRAQTANTNTIYFAERFMIPWEGGIPFVLDPVTLDTKGTFDFGGAVQLNMTAHPKIDPVTGELFFFAHRPIAPYIVYYVANPKGEVTKAVEVDAPYHSFMHDFLITEKYAILPVLPITMSADNVKRTGNFVGWEPEKNSHIGIMPRNGDVSRIKWFEVEPFAQFHFFNAYDEGNKVVMLTPAFDKIYHFDLLGNPAPIDPRTLNCRLLKFTFDMVTGAVTKDVLDDLALDYQRVDPATSGARGDTPTATRGW